MTQNDDNSFGRARERVRTALAAMGFGNPEPYIDCWAKSDEATLFGAWGPIERGYARLTETFRWVGSRFKSGALVPEDIVCFELALSEWKLVGMQSHRKQCDSILRTTEVQCPLLREL